MDISRRTAKISLSLVGDLNFWSCEVYIGEELMHFEFLNFRIITNLVFMFASGLL